MTLAVLAAVAAYAAPAQMVGNDASARATAPTQAQIEMAARAIESAVRVRVGTGARVDVKDLELRGTFADANGITAVLAPESRAGERIRIALKGLRGRSRSPRIGEAYCTLRVQARAYRVLEVVARGATLGESAVEPQLAILDGVRLQPLAPSPVGARAARDLAPGDVVFARDVVLPPAVRSGDTVSAEFASGVVQVQLQVIATQDGNPGEEIRLVNPSSGRPLRGRVVAPGRVEVSHGT